MRSTPRTEKRRPRRLVAGAVALLIAAFVVSWIVTRFPKAPIGPRYVGAGQQTPQAGGTFIFSAGSNIHTLDPHFAYDTLSTAACRLIYDGLLDYDYDGNMVPSLAADLPEVSEGGRVFRFRLRDGIKFHSGREIRAEDISWSLHRLLSKAIGSPGFPFFKSILGAPAYHRGESDRVEGIVVLDDKTIEFRLDEADQTFLNALAMPFSYPLDKEHVEKLEAEAEDLRPRIEKLQARWERDLNGVGEVRRLKEELAAANRELEQVRASRSSRCGCLRPSSA